MQEEVIATNLRLRFEHGIRPGVLPALGAALLFGAATPVTKPLVSRANPWLLAGFLYLGSGAGLYLFRRLRGATAGKLMPGRWPWLIGAILAGGVAGPVLLMFGLAGMAASTASLLLNLEGVFTALLAWFLFRENFDRRIVAGMATIFAGTVILSWPGRAGYSGAWPALAVVSACVAWAFDNNLTRKIALADATWIASIKGLAAGLVNLSLGFTAGAQWPSLSTVAGAMLIGWLGYGISLSLFVIGLRHLGTARTGAYFSIAPFFGAVLAVPLLGEPVSRRLLSAGLLMAAGVWLHVTERHGHEHTHDALEHEHEHSHDVHHQHRHDELSPPGTDERHWHRHEPVTHHHVHYPDEHHRHSH